MIEIIKDMTVSERKQIAEKVGVTYDFIYQIGIGYRKPSAKMAKLIHKATRGKVNKKVLLPEIFT